MDSLLKDYAGRVNKAIASAKRAKMEARQQAERLGEIEHAAYKTLIRHLQTETNRMLENTSFCAACINVSYCNPHVEILLEHIWCQIWVNADSTVVWCRCGRDALEEHQIPQEEDARAFHAFVYKSAEFKRVRDYLARFVKCKDSYGLFLWLTSECNAKSVFTEDLKRRLLRKREYELK